MANEITLNVSLAFAQAGVSDLVAIVDLLRDGPNSPDNKLLHIQTTFGVATVSLDTGGVNTASSYILVVHRGTVGRIDIGGTAGDTPTISLEAGDVTLWRNFANDIEVTSDAADVPVEFLVIGA